MSLLLFTNLVVWGLPLLLFGVLKFVIRRGDARRRLIVFLAGIGGLWSATNRRILRLLPTRWDVQQSGELLPEGRYLIFSNHISWADVLVLFSVLHTRVAFIRFFLKQALFWFPIAGQAAWALDFPFMKRYSAEYLARHPEKRGQDLETTRVACRRLRRAPFAILNFLEGTRFTREKHADQDSPYRHLLRPRVGGAAFVLASLGELLDGVIDVTIAYPSEDVTIWAFVSGKIESVHVRIRKIDIPREFLSAPITEPGFARDRFKVWIETLWREKDHVLDTLPANRYEVLR